MTTNQKTLNNILNSFNINAKCIQVQHHRHFVYYDLELEPGTRISKIKRYRDELALAMKAHSSLLVQPIPSQGVVRLQTTLSPPDKIDFDQIYQMHSPPEDQFFPFLLGETDDGEPLWMDMAQNPHLLIAGSTGSGKSVLLHTLIANIAQRFDTSLHLVDTKKVEFQAYADRLPALASLSQNYEEAMKIIEFLIQIMEARYQYMAEMGVNRLEDYPSLFSKIVLVVDEVADLILYEKGSTFENQVARLAQKARAAGIYLVFATQRPSTDVLTGLIKANFPGRLSCKVSSKMDSRVILDRMGAENLVGRGDAICHTPQYDTTRLQVAFSSPQQILGESLGKNQHFSGDRSETRVN